jgi:hypothetical protein
MRPAARIAAFAALLTVVLAGAALAGSRVDPDVDESAGHETEDNMQMTDTHTEKTGGAAAGSHGADAGSHGATASGGALPGLAVTQGGFTLALEQTSFAASRPEQLRFRVTDEAGDTVRDFDVEHERRMHLIVVRRDFAGFQHLHPAQEEDGSWSVDIPGLEPGVHRVFADFSSGGTSVTPATDVFVPGGFVPEELPEPASVADAGDGYAVAIDSADLHAGETVPVRFTVSRDGEELEGVEPYLGADGHLVALREGDQAFLHTHPEGEAGGSGPIAFDVEYPSAGRYRLFLQFRHGGEVRTAEFTQVVEPADSHGGAE